jgi:MoaA/NifB/PqqE/SkfB family radical SAM enzyme
MGGRSLDEYGAPLFLAWQLTNRCEARCLACCEESGPDKGWRDELRRDEALGITRQIIDLGIPYVAFGGGEPLNVPHCWDIFELLAGAGIAIKLETNGVHIDDAAASRLHDLGVECIQISVDGATPETHARVRPGSSYSAALAAIDRLAALGTAPQHVFVPTRLNIDEIVPAYELAARHGCAAFVTGPLMRLGRATAAWDELACDDATWHGAVAALRARAAEIACGPVLSIYPWDILTELERRLESPQAMLLVVPNGKIKLLNALPFAPADLRRVSLAEAWQAYRAAWRETEVADFIADCRNSPGLLRHANETWEMRPALSGTGD